MAEIKPFRGIRYNDERHKDLSCVISPPYDAISRTDHRQLCELSDRNIVQLILGERLNRGTGRVNSYARSAALLEKWLVNETLIQDRVPAIYLLDQEFEADGERKVRRGFAARLRVEAFGKGSVFAHRERSPGPTADRLALTRATRMNMSPVLGLYRDDDGAAAGILARMAEVDPVAEGTGIDGVRNVLRGVFHKELIARLVEALSNKQIIVADGHNRYDAAVAYRNQLRQDHGLLELDKPYEFVSVVLVAMDDPGLIIRPTHQLVKRIKSFSPDELFERAATRCEVEEVESDGRAILGRLAELADRHAFGILTAGGSRIFVRKSLKSAAAGPTREFDAHILHHEILAEMLALGPDAWKKNGPVRYVSGADECIAAVNDGTADLAALLNPMRLDDVETAALASETVPPESTCFYPGLPTGTVINPLI